MLSIQEMNIRCLPENYSFKYHYYHYFSWPNLLYVAEDLETDKIVGYVLGKVDDAKESELNQEKAHVTSLAVHHKYRYLFNIRRLGIAANLMEQTHRMMKEVFGMKTVTLHVRFSNIAARNLYLERLKYTQVNIDKGYYADGEDAHFLKKVL